MVMDEKDLKYLKSCINNLFSKYVDEDLTDNLRYISQYYSYLADSIDYQKFIINADSELIESFESVYLWLKEKLLLYPDSIRHQVEEIFEEKKLCEIFAIISNLDQSHVKEIKLNRFLKRLPKFYSLLGIKFAIPSSDLEFINIKNLFEVKMSLKRISQILKYARTINISDYDESFNDFRTHYDPNIINKNKIFTLINYFRVQLEHIPDENQRKIISDKIDSLEAELRRPKVRWAVIFTGFFILFGFLADLKTLDSDVYTEPLKTIERIISVLHNDGKVQETQPKLLSDNSRENSGNSNKKPKKGPPIIPEAINIKREDDE